MKYSLRQGVVSKIKTFQKAFINISTSVMLLATSASGAAPLLFAQTAHADSFNECVGTAYDCGPVTAYATIQSAIDAASSGDSIQVTPGTYNESVNINKAVNIIGAGAADTTIAAVGENDTTLDFSTNNATVSGFTITHKYSNAEEQAWNFNNKGVDFQGTDGNTLKDSTISMNRNGIYLNDSTNTHILNDTITNNRTGLNMVNHIDGAEITGNTISGNWTLGAVYYYLSSTATNFSTVTVSGNTFDQNWYTEFEIKDAGASTGTLNLTNNTFNDNGPFWYSTSSDPSLNEPGMTGAHPTTLGGSDTMPASGYPTIRIYNSPNVTIKYQAPAAAPPTMPSVPGDVIYNSITSPLPASYPSEGFEATGTSALGDKVTFGGSSHDLDKAAVTLTSWACKIGHWTGRTDTCTSTPGSTFSQEVTLNLYNVASGGSKGSLIASVPQTFNIPYRPTTDSTCPNATNWRDTNGDCHGGYNYVAVFDLSGITVPNSIYYTVAFNTRSYGSNPAGVTGPYDSLNVGVNSAPPSVGTVGSSAYQEATHPDTTLAGYHVASMFTAEPDTSAPNISVRTMPANGSYVNNDLSSPRHSQEFSINATDSDSGVASAKLHFVGIYGNTHSYNFSLTQHNAPHPEDWFKYVNLDNIAEGTYQVWAEATDSAGNISYYNYSPSTHKTLSKRRFTVDNNAPIVKIDTPTDGSTISTNNTNDTLTVKGQFTDSVYANYADLYLIHNGTLVKVDFVSHSHADGSTLGTFDVNALHLQDGQYTLKLVGTDLAHHSTTVTSTFTLDNTAPAAPSITAPGARTWHKTSPITDKWTSVSDPSGVRYQIAYYYDDGHSFAGTNDCPGLTLADMGLSNKAGSDNYIACRNVNGTTRQHNVGANEEGGVTIWVRAIDGAGNKSAWSKSVHYYYDHSAPTLSNFTFPTITGAKFTLSGDIHDNMAFSGVHLQLINMSTGKRYGSAQLYPKLHIINNLSTGLDAHWSHDYDADALGLPDGVYTANVSVSDKAGNSFDTHWTYQFTLDTKAPVVAVTPAPGNSPLHGTKTFKITVTDDNLDLSQLNDVYVHINKKPGNGNSDEKHGEHISFTKVSDTKYTGDFTVNTKNLKDGTYWLSLDNIKDLAGNGAVSKGQIHFHPYTIDNTAPDLVSAHMYVNGQEVHTVKPGDTVNVTAKFSDPSGVDHTTPVEYWVHNFASGQRSTDYIVSGATLTWNSTTQQWEGIFTVPADGNYTSSNPFNEAQDGNYINFRATDTLGNSQTNGNIKFTINNTPTVTGNYFRFKAQPSDNIQVGFTTDNFSDATGVTVKIFGQDNNLLATQTLDSSLVNSLVNQQDGQISSPFYLDEADADADTAWNGTWVDWTKADTPDYAIVTIVYGSNKQVQTQHIDFQPVGDQGNTFTDALAAHQSDGKVKGASTIRDGNSQDKADIGGKGSDGSGDKLQGNGANQFASNSLLRGNQGQDQTGTDDSKTDGNVQGDSINLSNSKKNTDANANNSGAWLGLGWWWLPILAVILAFLWFLLVGRRARDNEPA